jgi:hypothetical protein
LYNINSQCHDLSVHILLTVFTLLLTIAAVVLVIRLFRRGEGHQIDTRRLRREDQDGFDEAA